MRGEETHALLFAYLDQELEVVRHMEMADPSLPIHSARARTPHSKRCSRRSGRHTLSYTADVGLSRL